MAEWMEQAFGVVLGGAIATVTQYVVYRWNISASKRQATHSRLLDLYSSMLAVGGLELERARQQEAHIKLWRPRSGSDQETIDRRKDWARVWYRLDRRRLTALCQLTKFDCQIAILEVDKPIQQSIQALRNKQPFYALPWAGENDPSLDAKFQKDIEDYQKALAELTQNIRSKYAPT